MENKVKRPISVWIAQGLFVFYALIMLLAFFLAIATTDQSNRSFTGVWFICIVDVILLGLLATAFLGMADRKPYGRWLGVGLLAFMVIFANLGKVVFPPSSSLPTFTIVIEAFFSIFVFIVMLHIALSDRVAVFFARKAEPIPLDHLPPPPPSFDA